MDQRNNLLALLSFIQCNNKARAATVRTFGFWRQIPRHVRLEIAAGDCLREARERKKFSARFRLRLVTSFTRNFFFSFASHSRYSGGIHNEGDGRKTDASLQRGRTQSRGKIQPTEQGLQANYRFYFQNFRGLYFLLARAGNRYGNVTYNTASDLFFFYGN